MTEEDEEEKIGIKGGTTKGWILRLGSTEDLRRLMDSVWENNEF